MTNELKTGYTIRIAGQDGTTKAKADDVLFYAVVAVTKEGPKVFIQAPPDVLLDMLGKAFVAGYVAPMLQSFAQAQMKKIAGQILPATESMVPPVPQNGV